MVHTVHAQQQKVAIHCHAGLGRTGLVVASFLVFAHRLPADHAIDLVRCHRPQSIQTSKQAAFVRDFDAFVVRIRRVYDPSLPDLATVLSRQRLYLHGPELQALRHVPKILHVCCARLTAWAAGTTGSDDLAILRILSEEEKATLVSCKSEVDEGQWERTAGVDGPVAVQMLLDWLQHLSPRLLHEGAEAMQAGKTPQEVTDRLSGSVCKILAVLLPALQRVASVTTEKSQHTLYEAFAKALVSLPPKTKNSDDVSSAIAFLRHATI